MASRFGVTMPSDVPVRPGGGPKSYRSVVATLRRRADGATTLRGRLRALAGERLPRRERRTRSWVEAGKPLGDLCGNGVGLCRGQAGGQHGAHAAVLDFHRVTDAGQEVCGDCGHLADARDRAHTA